MTADSFAKAKKQANIAFLYNEVYNVAHTLEREVLNSEAKRLGKDPIRVERAYKLLRILDELKDHPKTKGKFSLRGGTAFNLFRGNLPRISQDIDLNYTGHKALDDCMNDMPQLNEGIREVLEGLGFFNIIPPTDREHTWKLNYTSVLGTQQELSIDINYHNRVPLFQQKEAHSAQICGFSTHFDVLNNYDLVAGKFNALFTRSTIAPRDVYDIYRIITQKMVDIKDPYFRVPLMVEIACHSPSFIGVKVPGLRNNIRSLQAKGRPIAKLIKDLEGIQWGSFHSEMKDTLSQEAFREAFGNGDKKTALDRFANMKQIVQSACNELLQFTPRESLFVQNVYAGHIKPGFLVDKAGITDRKHIRELRTRIGENSYLNHLAALSARLRIKHADKLALRSDKADDVFTLPSLEKFMAGKRVDIGHPFQRRAKDLEMDIILNTDDIDLIRAERRRMMRKDLYLDREDALDQAIRSIYILRDKAKKRERDR